VHDGKRRANWGESSIWKDARGKWHGAVSVGVTYDGRRLRKHVRAERRPDVVKRVRELEQQRDAGTLVARGPAPEVGEWLAYWLDDVAARRVRPSTLRGYRCYVEHRIVPAIGHIRLDALRPDHLDRLYRSLANQGLAPASILQVHRVLSRALKVAVQRGRVPSNVCTLIHAPRVTHHEVEPPSQAEARWVLAAARGQHNAARWTVALSLGLRQREALGLQWKDVDFDAGTMRVRRAAQRQVGQGIVFVEPKSAAGRRTISLPDPLIEALWQHRTAQDTEREKAADLWQDFDLIFGQPNGRPIEPRVDYEHWKRLLRKAGVREVRLHDARHTAASLLLLLLLQGVSPRVVMEILGHSQIALTMNTCSHVAPELSRNAADRIAAALWDDESQNPGPAGSV
jgi:integrase